MKYFIIVLAAIIAAGCQLVVINSDNTKEVETQKTEKTHETTVIEKEKEDGKKSN